MSYDVAVWVGSRPPDDTAALATFPDLDELDEHVDGSVWEEGHMIGNVMGPFFYFAMTYPGARKALTFVAETAAAHGLVCFDPQSMTLI